MEHRASTATKPLKTKHQNLPKMQKPPLSSLALTTGRRPEIGLHYMLDQNITRQP